MVDGADVCAVLVCWVVKGVVVFADVVVPLWGVFASVDGTIVVFGFDDVDGVA